MSRNQRAETAMIRMTGLGLLGAMVLAGCVAVPNNGPRHNWGNERRDDQRERREDQRERREDQRERQEDRRNDRRDDRRN